MLTLWGRANSVNVKKVLWCLEEAAVPYERIDAGGAFGRLDKPAFRALNPNGLVPTIEDGDVVVWESNAIVRYLAARYGAGTLWPEDPAARALGDRWMDWTLGNLVAPFRDVFWTLVRTPPEQRDMALVAAGVARCGTLLAIADAALAERPFLSGDRLGMGDIPLGAYVYLWFELPIERSALPHLEAWYRRLAERPAYRKAVMVPLT